MASQNGLWNSTACIICSLNCGLKVQLSDDGQSIARIKGDESHPASQGYLCNKAARINYYQHQAGRVYSPMRRKSDGTYEAIDWDTAIPEIAEKLAAVRDTYGGDKILYYGGGGQGNHLPIAYARSTLQTLGVRYRSNALAQEKTGEFWVADRMFGKREHGDFEHAEVLIFLGKNPWHSHGFHRARAVLREASKDTKRTVIVIDPKRTETADLADIHLAVKPARDAWLLAGMVATMVQEDLINHDWLEAHTVGLDQVSQVFSAVDIADCATKCGLEEAIIRKTTHIIARAQSAAFFEDLGVQMNRHSTLVSYLQRLLWVLAGHFGRPGTHYIAQGFGKLSAGGLTDHTQVTGSPVIGGLVPCNVVATEVLADHPDRTRAMIIESANPVHSLADSPQWREAMRALEFSVVIDVAMTETARAADYVLPATTQFEKAEATFFSSEFPDNYFHLRHPLFEPPPGPLDEAEIHGRLADAWGVIDTELVEDLRAVLKNKGRAAFRDLFFAKMAEDRAIAAISPILLYRTLGDTLPPGMRNGASMWTTCHRFAKTHREAVTATGLTGDGADLGEALFDTLIDNPSGVVFSRETWDQVWQRIPNGRIQLALDDLLEVVVSLGFQEPQETSAEYPFLLSAGERRAYTANALMRDPAWRKKDATGTLHIHPLDAARLKLEAGANVLISTKTGRLITQIELSDRMYPGHISLPNGLGLDYPDEQGNLQLTGAPPNELTAAEDCDEFVATPWHKSVPARIEALV